MDEEKRDRRMDYAEEQDDFAENRMEEEVREHPTEYRDGNDTFIEEVDEELHTSEQEVRSRVEASPDRERSAMEKELVPLLRETDAEQFRSHWQDIQTNFVDDPRSSVERADELVARVINSITENFADERDSLEEQWNRGEEASTEDLRIAIKRYRSFFNRLLTLETMGTEEHR
jgi:hypothetical protein